MTRFTSISSFTILLLCTIVLFQIADATYRPRPKRPHVLFFLADDLGFADVGYQGSQDIPTPTIDALAAEGVKLGRYYVQPLCSPSRTALMTGRYPSRVGLQESVISSSSLMGVPLEETFLPQWLQSSDDDDERYEPHIIGKWHLGQSSWALTPTERGFKSHFGFLGSHVDYYTGFINGGYDFRFNRTYYNQTGQYNGYLFVDRAKNIIQNHDPTTPLFLYFSSENPHTPIQVPSYYETQTACAAISNATRRTYCGMVVFLDEQLKNVTDALKAKGMWDDTVLIFSTDNGGDIYQYTNSPAGVRFTYGTNWPLRGTKFTYWEGGVHGVGFVTGKGLRNEVKGTTYNGLMHISDWYLTIIEGIARVDIPNSYKKRLDSVNMWKAITRGEASPRKEVMINFNPIDTAIPDTLGVNGALIVGDIKVIYSKPGGSYIRTIPYVPPPHINATNPCAPFGGFFFESTRDVHLFNLTADPFECRDIAYQNVTFTWQYLSRLFDYGGQMQYPQDRTAQPGASPSLHGGIWTPWVDDARRQLFAESTQREIRGRPASVLGFE